MRNCSFIFWRTCRYLESPFPAMRGPGKHDGLTGTIGTGRPSRFPDGLPCRCNGWGSPSLLCYAVLGGSTAFSAADDHRYDRVTAFGGACLLFLGRQSCEHSAMLFFFSLSLRSRSYYLPTGLVVPGRLSTLQVTFVSKPCLTRVMHRAGGSCNRQQKGRQRRPGSICCLPLPSSTRLQGKDQGWTA
jgi:hypothetical protein